MLDATQIELRARLKTNKPLRAVHPVASSAFHKDFAQITAFRQLDVTADGPGVMSHFDSKAFVSGAQAVEAEIAEAVGLRLRDDNPVAEQHDLDALGAIDAPFGIDSDAAAYKLSLPTIEAAAPDPRSCAEFGPQRPQILASCALGHGLIVELHRFEDVGRTDLTEARLLPAGVEQMGVEDPGLTRRARADDANGESQQRRSEQCESGEHADRKGGEAQPHKIKRQEHGDKAVAEIPQRPGAEQQRDGAREGDARRGCAFAAQSVTSRPTYQESRFASCARSSPRRRAAGLRQAP